MAWRQTLSAREPPAPPCPALPPCRNVAITCSAAEAGPPSNFERQIFISPETKRFRSMNSTYMSANITCKNVSQHVRVKMSANMYDSSPSFHSIWVSVWGPSQSQLIIGERKCRKASALVARARFVEVVMGSCSSCSAVATPEAPRIHSVILRVEQGNPDAMPSRSASHDKAQDAQTAAACRRPSYSTADAKRPSGRGWHVRNGHSPKSSSEVCSDAENISANNLNSANILMQDEDTVLLRAALDELEKSERRVSFQVFDKKPPSLTRNTKPVSRKEETPERPRAGSDSRRRHK